MRTIGVEVEHISTLNHRSMASLLEQHGVVIDPYATGHYTCREGCYSGWQVKTDGSINPAAGYPYGVELASPPMTLAEANRLFKKVFLLVGKSGAVNRSCGLHVHVHAPELGNALNNNITLEYLRNVWGLAEPLFYTYMPPSRRVNNYCRPGIVSGDKYRGFNMTHLAGGDERRMDTVEFRMHSATLNARKILSFMALCERMVDALASRTFMQPIDPKLNVEVPTHVVRKRNVTFEMHKTTDSKNKWVVEERDLGTQGFPNLGVAYDELHERLKLRARDPLQAFNYPEHGNAMSELCKKLAVPNPYKCFLESRYEYMLDKYGPFRAGMEPAEMEDDEEDFYREPELDESNVQSAGGAF